MKRLMLALSLLSATALLAQQAVVLLVGVVIGFHATKRIFSAPRAQERRLTANPAEAPVLNGVISPDGK